MSTIVPWPAPTAERRALADFIMDVSDDLDLLSASNS